MVCWWLSSAVAFVGSVVSEGFREPVNFPADQQTSCQSMIIKIASWWLLFMAAITVASVAPTPWPLWGLVFMVAFVIRPSTRGPFGVSSLMAAFASGFAGAGVWLAGNAFRQGLWGLFFLWGVGSFVGWLIPICMAILQGLAANVKKKGGP